MKKESASTTRNGKAYGSDYGALEDEIKELLVNWEIADTSEEPTLDRK